jgi:hypothetical protein
VSSRVGPAVHEDVPRISRPLQLVHFTGTEPTSCGSPTSPYGWVELSAAVRPYTGGSLRFHPRSQLVVSELQVITAYCLTDSTDVLT